jgi:thiol:disulfide interchange protein
MLVGTVIFGLNPISAAADGIHWTASPQRAVDAAQRSGRMIVVTVGADWCHYCKKMERDVWQQHHIASLVGESFIPLKLTNEQHAELIGRLQVQAFPTTLVFSPDRKLVARIDGYVDAASMQATLQRLRTTHQSVAVQTMPQR